MKPDHMERRIHLKQRGLTPRNITPKMKSHIIQVAAQHQSNIAKEKHQLLSSLDEQIKERQYADLAKERLQEDSIDNSNRLIGIDNLRDGIAATLCRPCVEQKIETVKEDTIMDFEGFSFQNEFTMSPSSIFASYKVSKIKNKRRKLNTFLQRAQVEV